MLVVLLRQVGKAEGSGGPGRVPRAGAAEGDSPVVRERL